MGDELSHSVDLLLLHIKRNQLRLFKHLTRMPSDTTTYVRCFRHVLLQGGPEADLGIILVDFRITR